LQSEPIIFSGSASNQLVEDICSFLKLPKGNIETQHFSDRETWVKINENVRGADVFVVQSTCTPTNDNLMELLFLAMHVRIAKIRAA
jgi:ribose-phosphate pyrophosphokinase